MLRLSSLRLVVVARVLFFALQTLMLMALVLAPLGLLPTKKARGALHFGISGSSVALQPHVKGTSYELSISNVHGDVSVRADGAMAASLVSHRRKTQVPHVIVIAGFGFVVCRSLRRLCLNIERGQVFTDPNLKLVRTVGLAFLIGGFAAATVEVWANYRFADLMAEYVAFENMELLRPPPGVRIFFEFYADSFMTGIILLVVAEVFRHGLKLQKDAELTV